MKVNSGQKNIVTHFLGSYLFLTGSWIYNQLVNMKRYKPIVLCTSTENLDIFPFKPIYSYSDLAFIKKVFIRLKYGWFEGAYFNYFYDILKFRNPLLLHCHFGDCGVDGLKIRKDLRIPIITTFYGSDMSQLPGEPYWQEQYEILFNEGDAFLVEGNFMKRGLVALGCPEEKIIVQHIGVELSRLEYKHRKLNNGESVKVLLAASFREKKGIPYAIKAFAKVRENCKNIDLTIIGDGPMRSEIEELIRNLNLDGMVTLLGYQPYPVFQREVMQSHIFLSPSVTASDGDTEGGSPVGITEAQATGMPVVSTYHADIPAVVLDGRTGYLSPERDVNSLAQNLEKLVSNPERWGIFGYNARRHIEEEYNIQKQIQRLEDIYQRVSCARI